jgi:hypothetical protein
MWMRTWIRFLTLMRILLFTLTADPDPASQNDADPCGSTLLISLKFLSVHFITKWTLFSAADPDPSDQYVFGPSGSGSFYHQAKIVRKTLIPTVL